jgi:hypothetical protein
MLLNYLTYLEWVEVFPKEARQVRPSLSIGSTSLEHVEKLPRALSDEDQEKDPDEPQPRAGSLRLTLWLW